MIWFDPTLGVVRLTAGIGPMFFHLRDRHLPRGYILAGVFGRSTVSLGCGCASGVQGIVGSHVSWFLGDRGGGGDGNCLRELGYLTSGRWVLWDGCSLFDRGWWRWLYIVAFQIEPKFVQRSHLFFKFMFWFYAVVRENDVNFGLVKLQIQKPI